MPDLSKSIEQLENDFWKDTDFPTGLVERCFLYRKIPVKDLTLEQIRTLISQQIGLAYLIPVALQTLKQDLLVEADLYEGDLLAAVLSVDKAYWQQFPHIKSEVKYIIDQQRQILEQRSDGNQFRQLLKKIDSF